MTNPYVTEVEVQDEGTIVLFRGLTSSAREYLAEMMPEDAQMFGDAYVVESRYAQDIVQDLAGTGFNLEEV